MLRAHPGRVQPDLGAALDDQLDRDDAATAGPTTPTPARSLAAQPARAAGYAYATVGRP